MFIYLLLITLAILLVYNCAWKPWRLHKWYANNFRRQGYRVLEVPFRPFGITLLDYYNFSRDADDAFKLLKEEYPKYDVALFNIFNSEYIDILSPDLHQ